MRRLAIASALLLAGCSDPARDPKAAGAAPEIAIAEPWARPTVAGQSVTAAYLTIANFGTGEDRLLSVEADPPLTASLHSSSNEGGIARMRPLEAGLAIPGRQSVTLSPGGTHVMIAGLAKPLAPGDTVELTLRFEKSGRRAVRFPALGEGGR